jgi:uncharacterized membrane protein YtjA (UPF0391 family)
VPREAIAYGTAGSRGRFCRGGRAAKPGENIMLRWAFIFLVVGLIAGLLGFTGIAGASIGIAKFLFFLFVAMFVLFLILGLTVYRSVTGGR